MGVCLSTQIKAESPFNTGLSEGEILLSSNLKNFNFSDLKKATRKFHPDNVLGKSDSRSVFKGWIDENSYAATKPGTGLVIAVKMLYYNGFQSHKEWLADVNYLAQLSHPHLVKLIGYCLEDERRLLVYEFMPRGSLDNHLFRRGAYSLSWNLRMKVALDVAKGLAFLHNADTKFVYHALKMSDILFDYNYNAKLSNFWLAKDGQIDDKFQDIYSGVNMSLNEATGYPAPEYIATGCLTARYNVYSFGVVLLEMLSGRRAIENNRPIGERNLMEWATPYLANKSKILRVLDSRLESQYSMDVAYKAATLALCCISEEPQSRPNMDEVVTSLEQLQDSN